MPEKFVEVWESTEPWMDFFLETFFELSTDRPAAMGVTPIPSASIRSQAAYLGLSRGDFPWFRDTIRAMDAHYLEKKNNKDGNT